MAHCMIADTWQMIDWTNQGRSETNYYCDTGTRVDSMESERTFSANDGLVTQTQSIIQQQLVLIWRQWTSKKQTGTNEQTNERTERTSERTNEWTIQLSNK